MASCAASIKVVVGLALGVVVAKSKARDFCVVSSLVRGVPVDGDGADKCRRPVRTATGTAMPTINAMAATGTTMTGRWYQTILYMYMYTVPVGYVGRMALSVLHGDGNNVALGLENGIASGLSPVLELRKIWPHVKRLLIQIQRM
jgi:hypothetical protein